MARTHRYYLSRIVKAGRLTSDGVIDAMRGQTSIQSREYAWTAVNIEEGEVRFRRKAYPFVAGDLAKYNPDAIVKVVDQTTNRIELRPEPDMLRAESTFVYFPDEAIIGHRLVWNEIVDTDFRKRMADIVLAHHRNFFVECELEPITDMTLFLEKLSSLDEVTQFKATVVPPNPLFGPFWRELRDYIRRRRLRRLEIAEKADHRQSVQTQAPALARIIASEEDTRSASADIGDAAILMAADGYGRAELHGKRDGSTVIVRTSDNVLQMKLDADLERAELALAFAREISRLNSARQLRHR